jgi:hypothetical protein
VIPIEFTNAGADAVASIAAAPISNGKIQCFMATSIYTLTSGYHGHILRWNIRRHLH